MASKHVDQEQVGETVADLVVFEDFPIALTINADPTAMQLEMLERMADANNLDDLFAARESAQSKNLVGHVVEIREVTWGVYQAADAEVPLAVIAVVDMADGEATKMVSTSKNITLFLARALQLNLLPFKARIGTAKTRSGFDVLFFERP